MDGIYESTATFPQFTESGVWTIGDIFLVDVAGNSATFDPADFGPDTISVTAISDTTPPVLESLSFTSTSVDTTSGPQNVTVTVRLTDDLSGTGNSLFVRFFTPSGSNEAFAFFNDATRISGNALDGIYESTATFPQFTESGVWTIGDIFLVDVAGNSATFDPADFGPDTINVTAISDTTPPVLESLSFTSTSVDTTSGPQNVTVTVRLTDDLSGTGNSLFVRFFTPSGSNEAFAFFNDATRISGNALDGIYESTATFPQFTESGVWTIGDIFLVDVAGNSATFDPADFGPDTINVNLTTSVSVPIPVWAYFLSTIVILVIGLKIQSQLNEFLAAKV